MSGLKLSITDFFAVDRVKVVIMTAKNYVVVTEQELESQHEKDGASVSYTYYYHGFMASRGLIEYGLATWKEEVYRMNNAGDE